MDTPEGVAKFVEYFSLQCGLLDLVRQRQVHRRLIRGYLQAPLPDKRPEAIIRERDADLCVAAGDPLEMDVRMNRPLSCIVLDLHRVVRVGPLSESRAS